MASKLRIMTAVVQYVLTESNDQGDPVAEYVSQPMRVFRAVHGDIWDHGDKQAFSDETRAKMNTLGQVPGLMVADAP